MVRHRGRGRGRGGVTKTLNRIPKHHIAAPTITNFPKCLTIHPLKSEIPSAIQECFHEFSSVQPYWSALEKLAPEYGGSPEAYKQCWTGISEDILESVTVDEESRFIATITLKDGAKLPIFVKRIHLLDPTTTMEGGYVWPKEGALPAPSDLWKRALAKINDPMNEAYVDALFALLASKLTENDISPHWCHCYGTYSARVDNYLFNVTDEYDSLKASPWWKRNQRIGLFKLYKSEEDKEEDFCTTGITDINCEDFVSITDEKPDITGDAITPIVEVEEEPTAIDGEPQIILEIPRLKLSRINEQHSSDSMSSMTETQQFVQFKDYPVQVTLLERAEGTMDELLEEEQEEEEILSDTKEARWAAWLFQVIAALIAAQNYFGFVHNDLHTNNIMWNSTDNANIYYRVHKGKETFLMKVPTYGRLMKIIDFGRATYTLPEPGGFFISDAFYPGNDAASQYNCEPFYDEEEPRVEPNPSFDLCRLAVSLLESLYPEVPDAKKPVKIMSKEDAKMYPETVSNVYNMLWEWLTDDAGKNILRTPSGEERYPDFDLYRALATDSHKAVPMRQIDQALFAGYRVEAKDIPIDVKIYSLHI